jgi:hypothetical protein
VTIPFISVLPDKKHDLIASEKATSSLRSNRWFPRCLNSVLLISLNHLKQK